ncbi:MerR family transcriptional regulator [Mycolicibacterium sp. BiH015]|uniref:MerR family transcriptional regulator n=1 Tax=Mycolicibacterium sp. BiH015 TaxID=3018808 RepID=UPI0022E88D0C|nr:MerR family transcriptional regulator [Mycolicibacterium sp. BiH015]MDA2892885.1 MerR family transcriptional regulator [Mycolicibacterium sp. BiH015]
MQLSELSEQSGVTVSTIKYYLREGLLPPGEKRGERRADYGKKHVARLRLLRVLREVGDVSVADLKGIVAAIDDRSRSVHQMFGAAFDALTKSPDRVADASSRNRADQLVEEAGWVAVRSDSPERERLAYLLHAVSDLGAHLEPQEWRRYLDLVDSLAAFEVNRLHPDDPAADRDVLLRRMVVGQVVFGELVLSLRRLAHEHHSAQRASGAARRP